MIASDLIFSIDCISTCNVLYFNMQCISIETQALRLYGLFIRYKSGFSIRDSHYLPF